jgi:hypothetical protein
MTQTTDQLRGDPHTTAGLAHRAFEDIAHAELAPDLLHIDRLALVGEARIPGDDEEPADARERGDDLLDHAVDEIFLLWITTHIREGQYRDRRLVGECQRGAGHCGRIARRADTVDMHRAGDVLELLVAHVFEGEVETTRGILLYPRRDADPAGVR